MEFLNALPIGKVIEQIRQTLCSHNRLILQAPPGAGKTTAVPLALINEPWLEGKKIIMLEPRRIAARTAAQRMAELLGEPVGERVGYQIRSEKRLSSHTKIVVVTEGILTRMLQNDPSLEDIALIIFDEFHERHLHSDLSLAFALQTQEYLRDDLKILVMSATLDTDAIHHLLDMPPLISSEGRSHPVSIGYRSSHLPPIEPKTLITAVVEAIERSIREDNGSILVFLPGEREIRRVESLLGDYKEIDIFPLYGNLSKEEQTRAILPVYKRKIVLTTNIAETSLTIEGISVVIDSGYEKVLTFDSKSGMERLITQRISRSSADQRAGRAGRLSAGKCYRLWSESAHYTLQPHKEAEIATCDLTPLALELSAWGESDLVWITPPPSKALEHGKSLLQHLGAIDSKSIITPHGKEMIRLGLHPRLAHMILISKKLGYQSEAILLAALLNERDPFSKSTYQSTDMRERFWLLCDFFRNNAVDTEFRQSLSVILTSAHELAKRLTTTLKLSQTLSPSMIALFLALAYPDRIARIRTAQGEKYLLSNGKEAILSLEDDLRGAEWLVVCESDGDGTAARIHRCVPIDLNILETYCSSLFVEDETINWNRETQKVEARIIRRLGAIILENHPIGTPDITRIKQTLLEGIRHHGLESLSWSDEVLSLLHRLRFLHHHEPDRSYGDFSDAMLLLTLEEWLLPHLSNQTSLKDCATLDLYTIFSSQLSWEEIQNLNALLPTHFTAPTGSRIPLDYSDPEAVVLAVRIQEVFGLLYHPSVMEGKVPLLIHLLSPARRPIQITRDLISFWNGSYSDVKKELKGRYPKHYWPDNPSDAQATTKTKKFISLQSS